MFKKILIANRGEIAVRVIRAAKELDIRTVAVYPEVDADGAHVRMADEAYLLKSQRGYLDQDALVAAALATGADAVHPGYGFLSENPSFAAKVAEAGLTFIGPSAEVIAAMGEKTEARRRAAAAGVPTVPGTEELGDPESALEAAARIGYPVMLKAAGGGGGRGIRIAKDAEELIQVFDTACREAQMAFGTSALYLEKVLAGARHIEIQIMADNRGNVVHLGERECSLQRRRQKVLEEAPSLFVSPALRSAMGEAAVALAKEVAYVGAGTVEFLVDREGKFYFLEMNTRIQVEHPVTEMVTGIDLVQEMIRVAAGEPLSVKQEEVQIRGHAVECRINAEDPAKGFRPSPGIVSLWNPPNGPWTRLDTYVYSGYRVTPFFDSLIGKLVVWGPDRTSALRRMGRALHEFEVGGIATTISLHRRLVSHPDIVAGAFDTQWLEKHLGELTNEGEEEANDRD